MRYFYICTAILGLMLCACSSSQKVTPTVATESKRQAKKARLKNAKLKQEALAFSLSIVESYFEEDCDRVFSLMKDSIHVFNDEKTYPKAGSEERVCEAIKRAVRHKEANFLHYLEIYDPIMMTKIEVGEFIDRPIPDFYLMEGTDFFFYGTKVNPGYEGFLRDDMLLFVVRKEETGWVISGVSS